MKKALGFLWKEKMLLLSLLAAMILLPLATASVPSVAIWKPETKCWYDNL